RRVWAAAAPDEATLGRFFDALGQQRSGQLNLVSADAATWIANTVARRCPAAVLCLDPFHVVRWATNPLDRVRRRTCPPPAPPSRPWPASSRVPDSRCGRTPSTSPSTSAAPSPASPTSTAA